MKKWFKGTFESVEDLRKEYLRLVMMYHPDRNAGKDTTKEMQEINAEYDILVKTCKFTSKEEGKKKEYKSCENNENIFKNIIDELIFVKGIEIEIIGSWLWIYGQTFAVKEQLKAMDFKWSKTSKAWYNDGNGNNFQFRKNGISMEAKREKYGSTKVTGRKETAKLK